MTEKKRSARNISPSEKALLLQQLKHLVLIEGKTQKKAARLLGVSENTVCKWVDDLGLKEEIKKLRETSNTIEIATKSNLHAFMAYVRIKHPDEQETIERLYREFSLRY